ncbi:MAG: Coenzyme F420 hydrogenase/dehydrogenase, beta subunit C-terminal domain [Lachnospiraceae bacterium]|nr:Coenzyme F420 hydrogenase/dehydrogenase, beta subunit C-terminal domain [Lachnospiraceae bacterium]
MNNIEARCKKDKCTGCGVCISICPQNCISYKNDELDNIYPKIDLSRCVECGLCIQVCPQLNLINKNKIKKCYAAWSSDWSTRESSASGGIASELYFYLIMNGYNAAGTIWNERSVLFKITKDVNDIMKFRNSKYVFSCIGACYGEISKLLKNKEKVFFVGLPCQVAAIKKYCQVLNVNEQNLILVDLVCHGVVPAQYLNSHIEYIEKKKKRRTERIFFRNPKFQTDKYYFTLEDKKGIFYCKKVKSDDCYQLAYHRALAYRENCYYCGYACEKRCGDLTLCDYTSVGKMGNCDYTNENVSCVMINTDKGERVWKKIISSGRIWEEERPIEEITNYEKQLNEPSPKHKCRRKFEVEYIKEKNFTKAAHKALKIDILWNVLNYILPLRKINDFRKGKKYKVNQRNIL